MPTFRKKPITIEAVRVKHLLADLEHNLYNSPRWVGDAFRASVIGFKMHGVLINTLEGQMFAEESDWIIRGVKGELYPCKPDIFEATYDAVSAAPAPLPDRAMKKLEEGVELFLDLADPWEDPTGQQMLCAYVLVQQLDKLRGATNASGLMSLLGVIGGGVDYAALLKRGVEKTDPDQG